MCESIAENPGIQYLTVKIGNLTLGKGHPVRIQSMTNTDTSDTGQTLRQCVHLFEAGCELIRLTVRNKKEARLLGEIKTHLLKKGIQAPVIADTHFSPEVALEAAIYADKIRINPGNFVFKQAQKDYNDESYDHELNLVRSGLKSLVQVCKHKHTAIRVGSNLGSLSQRILWRYGNTAEGMVMAALEFVEIMEEFDFFNVVISMKASDVGIMVNANRLLMNEMIKREKVYPVHLGVTEAGSKFQGVIKSSCGIATLLKEGIGDTIRVSLTGDPVEEIPVAKKLIKLFCSDRKQPSVFQPKEEISRSSFFERYGIEKYPVIGTSTNPKDIYQPDLIFNPDAKSKLTNKYGKEIPLIFSTKYVSAHSGFLMIHEREINEKFLVAMANSNFEMALVLEVNKIGKHQTDKLKSFSHIPVIIKIDYSTYYESFIIQAAGDLAPLLIDNLVDGLWLEHHSGDSIKTAFEILQACGKRRLQAEFISCPTCGRTLYDMEPVIEELKSRLAHLKKLKIAVMGCMVNGPGEMADADYGYIGSGRRKVNLYKDGQLIKKSVDQEKAVETLISLIKSSGDWIQEN